MNNIREIRRQKDITQSELADKIGVSYSVIAKYESGQINPPAHRIKAIASALDVSIDSLLINIEATPDYVQHYSRALRYHKYYAELVLFHSNGICELCKEKAPFNDKNGYPYLEAHHVVPVAYGGSDTTDNIVALCPNCHAKIHVCENKDDVEIIKKAAANHNY